MLAMRVDQGGDRALVEIIEAAADQREPFVGQVTDWWRKIELASEPGFDSVLVRRGDVGEVGQHQRADVAGDHFAFQSLPIGRVVRCDHQQADEHATGKG